jgi:VWFA-related protein
MHAQVPIFKGRLDVVRTEVAVIDNKTGKAITGLTEKDFTISENGVRQTISTFVDQYALRAQGVVGDPAETADPSRNRRVFLFVFDVGWDGPFKVYEGVAEFIRTKLDPQDLVGVLAMTRLTPFTTDHERVAAVVDRLKFRPPLSLRFAATKAIFRKTPVSTKEEVIDMTDEYLEPGSAGKGFFRDATPYLLGTPEYLQNDAADTVRGWRGYLAINEVLKVVAGIQSLRRVAGNKHLVFLTLGPPPFVLGNEGIGLRLESTEDDRRLAARANDAGVAIDIIQTGGPGTDAFAIMSHMNVAEHSGGQFSGLRVASEQLARVSEATTKGYVLGYVPSNPELDRSYRNIKVTLNRKDVTLVYRRGYTAATVPEPLDPEEMYTRSRMREAVAGNIDMSDLRVKATAVPVTEAGKKSVRFDFKIDISPLELAEVNGRWMDELDLLVVCGDAKRRVIGKLDQRMTLSMSAEMRQQAIEGGVPYSVTIPVDGVPAIARVVVFNFKTDRLGTATVMIR